VAFWSERNGGYSPLPLRLGKWVFAGGMKDGFLVMRYLISSLTHRANSSNQIPGKTVEAALLQ